METKRKINAKAEAESIFKLSAFTSLVFGHCLSARKVVLFRWQKLDLYDP